MYFLAFQGKLRVLGKHMVWKNAEINHKELHTPTIPSFPDFLEPGHILYFVAWIVLFLHLSTMAKYPCMKFLNLQVIYFIKRRQIFNFERLNFDETFQKHRMCSTMWTIIHSKMVYWWWTAGRGGAGAGHGAVGGAIKQRPALQHSPYSPSPCNLLREGAENTQHFWKLWFRRGVVMVVREAQMQFCVSRMCFMCLLPALS